MKLKTKAKTLTGVISLLSAMYLPQASAMTDLGTATPAAPTYFSESNLAGGTAFSNIFSFTVGDNYLLSGSLIFTDSTTVYSSDPTNPINTGLALDSFMLLNPSATNSLVATGGKSDISGGSTVVQIPGTSITQTTTLDYVTFSLNNALLAPGTYWFEITGHALGSPQTSDGYTGSFSVALSSIATAVPVPGAAWLFAGGLGLLSFTRRQNQKV
jgi:hypothetical protein